MRGSLTHGMEFQLALMLSFTQGARRVLGVGREAMAKGGVQRSWRGVLRAPECRAWGGDEDEEEGEAKGELRRACARSKRRVGQGRGEMDGVKGSRVDRA